MARRCKCLIVDDHPIFRKGILDLLVQEGACQTVVEAGHAAAALAAVRREAWDLVILDVALPDKHGIEVLKEMKLFRPRTPVLLFSLYPEREFAIRGLKAGAAGYLTKDCSPQELLSAVEEVTAGRRYITKSLAAHLASFVGQGQPDTPHDLLSDREMEVLRLFGQGKRPSQIAQDLSLSVKTVSTYRARLLRKLSFHTTAQLVRYAIEHQLTI